METNAQYSIIKHIKYEISVGEEERVLIIPNINGVPDMRRVLCLSDTSLHIWRMMTEQKNYGQMVEQMSQKYNKESIEVGRDLDEFLGILLEKGYVSVIDSGV